MGLCVWIYAPRMSAMNMDGKFTRKGMVAYAMAAAAAAAADWTNKRRRQARPHRHTLRPRSPLAACACRVGGMALCVGVRMGLNHSAGRHSVEPSPAQLLETCHTIIRGIDHRLACGQSRSVAPNACHIQECCSRKRQSSQHPSRCSAIQVLRRGGFRRWASLKTGRDAFASCVCCVCVCVLSNSAAPRSTH